MNRKYSLRQNSEIEKLVKFKMSVGNKFYAIYFHRFNGDPKIAFSVSKKNGNAVERNYEKKVVKEIIRSHLGELINLKMLIIVKPTTKNLTFLEKKTQIEKLLKAITKESNNEETKTY